MKCPNAVQEANSSHSDDRSWLSLTCDREVQQGGLKTIPLPAFRETPYPFVLVTEAGEVPFDDNLVFGKPLQNPEIDHAMERVEAAVSEGILLFQESEHWSTRKPDIVLGHLHISDGSNGAV